MMHLAPSRKGGAKHGIKSAGRECGACRSRRAAPEDLRMPVPEPIAAAAAGVSLLVAAPRRGYGSACLAALDYLRRHQPPEVVVFVDADYSDHPEELPRLTAPIVAGDADLVIGSPCLGRGGSGAPPSAA